MNNLLDTLATFNEDDLRTIRVAINNEIERRRDDMEVMIKANDLVTAKQYLHEKELLDKFWSALFTYEKER